MKKSSLVLIALLLAAPIFADEAQKPAEPLLTLASADTSASLNLQSSEAADFGAVLDKEVKEASASLSAKIASELETLIDQAAVVDFKF
jgi:hypothetical protein